MGALLLESIEGLGEAAFLAGPGEIWESLQSEKEEVGRNLLLETNLSSTNDVYAEHAAADEYVHEIEWRIREQLEGRLRDINDAQDRLIDGAYGNCVECGDEIEIKRLAADPAACRCLGCQQSIEGDERRYERSRLV
jgi:DnaK suppressor protein